MRAQTRQLPTIFRGYANAYQTYQPIVPIDHAVKLYRGLLFSTI